MGSLLLQISMRIKAISRALVSKGIKTGDTMISTNNRTGWCVMDVDSFRCCLSYIPTISSKDYKYILNHLLFVSDQEVYDKIKSIQKM